MAVRGALWLLASAWVALGLAWGGLHFLIVPRIGDFRPWIEQQAARTLGVAVRIGDVAARSNGLIPSLELRDVHLLDAQGREALKLPSVLAALSPRSAVGLGFEQLYVDGPELDVRKGPDGRIWIAGLLLPTDQDAGGAAADWLFAQTELAVRHGVVRWTDESRNAPTLELRNVDLVLRNAHRAHRLRLDADPPQGWGTRLTLMADFRQPLLTRRSGNWKEWTGQWYAQADRIDVAALRQYVDWDVDVSRGAGALRAWLDLDRMQVVSAAADVAMRDVTVRMAPALDAMVFNRVAGRLGIRRMTDGLEYSTQGLAFDTPDGTRWPGGNVRLRMVDAAPGRSPSGEFSADQLDLLSMVEIANRLPWEDTLRARLKAMRPQGRVREILASWQGPLDKPTRFTVEGRVAGLVIASQGSGETALPGVRGADIDFDVNQAGGKATLAMQGGALWLPGLLERPQVRLDQLAGVVQWRLEGTRMSVDASKVRFSNPDMQGELQAKWQTAEGPPGAAAATRLPGVLDVQGSLSRAELAAIAGYLPLAMPAHAREYLQHALLGGAASNVKFKAKGDLAHFPFVDPKRGEFRISADIKAADIAYGAGLVEPGESGAWPALAQLSGELVMDQDTLQIRSAKGAFAGSAGVQIGKADVTLRKLFDAPVVSVVAEARGPLAGALEMVNDSPLGAWTNHALAHSSATGNADYRFKLVVPVLAADKAVVQGTVVLTGNDIQVNPETPRLTRARGVIAFNENGFSVTGAQARALGGEVRVEGGIGASPSSTAPAPVLRIQGLASAEGLRQASELGIAARLGRYASGAAGYSATLGMRRGVPELLVTSNLSGMALNLPAPFSKGAEAVLPLRLEMALARSAWQPGAVLRDQLQLDLGRLAHVVYLRDISGPEPKVLRGSVGIGLAEDEAAPLPPQGVAANISVGQVDLDAWATVLSELSGSVAAAGLAGSVGMAYLPDTLAIRAKELQIEGRKLNNLLLGGGREGPLWRVNLEATQLNGYVEYRQPQGPAPGRLFARLAYLVIGQSTAQDVESLLEQQPVSIPALDIVVEDFELRGKKLGRLDIQAVNALPGPARDSAREWRLNRFNIATPEATLTASGNWAAGAVTAGSSVERGTPARRRTALNFRLDIVDSGDVLSRFGMPGVIAKGKGKIEGQVGWVGSPITLDYPSMSGGFNVNVETGQFLKVDPGIGKLLGVLSLQSLPRRLALDFRDVFSEGFSFDFVRGDVTIEQGIARTNNLQMKGVNAAVLMEGQADIAKETQLLKVVVIPEINAGSASLVASVINPLVGLSTFLAQIILRKPLIEATTQEFQIDGTWADPRVAKVERK